MVVGLELSVVVVVVVAEFGSASQQNGWNVVGYGGGSGMYLE